MNKNHLALPILTGAFLLFAACGDDVTKTTVVNETTGIASLEKGEALPDCDSLNAGEALYAADSAKIYVCGEDGWQALNVADTVIQKDSVFISKMDTVVISQMEYLYGADGTSCTAEVLQDFSGYKILCGDDSVGVLLNGSDGKDGEDGQDGSDGSNCTLTDSGNGVVSVQCANDTVTLYKALCGTEPYDPENSEFFCKDGSFYFTDSRDGQTYRVTTIGTQTWMAENLNYAYTQSTATLDSLSYCYDNELDSCAKYGRLYLWAAAMDSAAVFSESGSGCGIGVACSATGPVRGVCPEGFHLPDSTEWGTLSDYVAANNGGEGVGTSLKATSGWSSGNGTDLFGFSALPGGFYVSAYKNVGSYADFWTATDKNSKMNALYYGLQGDGDALTQYANSKLVAYSVRCVKD